MLVSCEALYGWLHMRRKLVFFVSKVMDLVHPSLDSIVTVTLHKHYSGRTTRTQQGIALELLGRCFDCGDFFSRSYMMCSYQGIVHGVSEGNCRLLSSTERKTSGCAEAETSTQNTAPYLKR